MYPPDMREMAFRIILDLLYKSPVQFNQVLSHINFICKEEYELCIGDLSEYIVRNSYPPIPNEKIMSSDVLLDTQIYINNHFETSTASAKSTVELESETEDDYHSECSSLYSSCTSAIGEREPSTIGDSEGNEACCVLEEVEEDKLQGSFKLDDSMAAG